MRVFLLFHEYGYPEQQMPDPTLTLFRAPVFPPALVLRPKPSANQEV